MSLNKSEQSLHIEPKRSRQLALLLLFFYGAIAVVLLRLDLPFWVSMILTMIITGLLVASWQRYVTGESSKSIKILIWDQQGDWTLVAADQHSMKARLLPGSYVFSKMIVLLFTNENRQKFSTILLPDSLDERIFHRLLLRLRFEKGYS